ncbi:hypothetical protein QWY81_17790 [Polaribacter undariae]|uniref:Uncharacterized protein n=1 Tax=Polaribacter sejongensis TaxID=985043 RepID=A0AAJ1VIJ3_9FLAO|nr:hypothetical protein [Polaribacter undariae]MDN3621324.1 hypothetical protein [Polaribacter undariae]UWD31866.1 hypothetical protein NQP51_17255 [Polaribacter undariae]
MSVIFEIGNDFSILKVTRRGKRLSVTCGAQTVGWGEIGKATLEETLKDQTKQIKRKLLSLDKTNKASKKGLQYLLNELEKDRQTELNFFF